MGAHIAGCLTRGHKLQGRLLRSGERRVRPENDRFQRRVGTWSEVFGERKTLRGEPPSVVGETARGILVPGRHKKIGIDGRPAVAELGKDRLRNHCLLYTSLPRSLL